MVDTDEYFLQTSRYIHLNPVKAHIVNDPQEYRWSSYSTIIGISDDKLVTITKTLAYFKNSVIRYRTFVDDIGHKYVIDEESIRREIGEDELWLPW